MKFHQVLLKRQNLGGVTARSNQVGFEARYSKSPRKFIAIFGRLDLVSRPLTRDEVPTKEVAAVHWLRATPPLCSPDENLNYNVRELCGSNRISSPFVLGSRALGRVEDDRAQELAKGWRAKVPSPRFRIDAPGRFACKFVAMIRFPALHLSLGASRMACLATTKASYSLKISGDDGAVLRHALRESSFFVVPFERRLNLRYPDRSMPCHALPMEP